LQPAEIVIEGGKSVEVLCPVTFPEPNPTFARVRFARKGPLSAELPEISGSVLSNRVLIEVESR
jgi:hypothetical protein